MSGTTQVSQCPHCALRFMTDSEMRSHIALDHPTPAVVVVGKGPEPDDPPAAPEAEAVDGAAAAPSRQAWWRRLLFGRR